MIDRETVEALEELAECWSGPSPQKTAATTSHEGWKKAHQLLFTMALKHELAPQEYLDACRYWDELYAGYRTDLEG